MSERRSLRHQATRQEIVAAAWRLAEDRGLTGWTMREIAEEVGMRAPSLYEYFASKNAIHDAMFADGYRQLLDEFDAEPVTGDPAEVLRRAARRFLDFYVASPARHQLLFQRVVPGFTPSAESYRLAEQALERLRAVLTDIGIDRPESADLWTALVTGLASQQATNDPDGDRWGRLVDHAVDMFLASERPR